MRGVDGVQVNREEVRPSLHHTAVSGFVYRPARQLGLLDLVNTLSDTFILTEGIERLEGLDIILLSIFFKYTLSLQSKLVSIF